MRELLRNYADRIAINLVGICSSCASVIVIAFATISFQSIKAAMANPVESLRKE